MLKFLQISDLHLGAKLTGIPAATAQQLREAVRSVVSSAFEQVTARDLDLVLMPGDLFEINGIEPAAQLRFIYQLAAEIAPVPVVIAPGNHDPYSTDSPYATEQQPDNVSLFTNPQFQLISTSAGPVTGRAYQEGEGYERLDWASLPPPADSALLLLHGSLLNAEDDRVHTRTIVPVTEEALLGSGYAYTALGHYHNQREFRRSGDRAFAAYSGCPQGQGWDELGPRGFIIGELATGGAQLEFIPAATHQFNRIRLELPEGWLSDPMKTLQASLTELSSSLSPAAAVDLRISGRWPGTDRDNLESALQEVLSKSWYTRPIDLSRVEFHPELANPGKSEVLDEFLTACRSGMEQATGNEEEGQAWELARYLGHRLLSGQGLPAEVSE